MNFKLRHVATVACIMVGSWLPEVSFASTVRTTVKLYLSEFNSQNFYVGGVSVAIVEGAGRPGYANVVIDGRSYGPDGLSYLSRTGFTESDGIFYWYYYFSGFLAAEPVVENKPIDYLQFVNEYYLNPDYEGYPEVGNVWRRNTCILSGFDFSCTRSSYGGLENWDGGFSVASTQIPLPITALLLISSAASLGALRRLRKS